MSLAPAEAASSTSDVTAPVRRLPRTFKNFMKGPKQNEFSGSANKDLESQ
jgi:hypothetical protein